jgi:glycosyltransferase involved in cell wall biosynthesis
MLPFYRTLDLFVSAARTEPFGLVIVEAMASSTPAVIATATDGACETIEDGVTGILVPVSDYEQLASAMRNLLVDVELRKDIVSRATKVAYERYSLDRMIEAVERIYRGI